MEYGINGGQDARGSRCPQVHGVKVPKPKPAELPVLSETDIAVVRVQARPFIERLGFNDVEIHSIIITLSELSTNLVFHAGQGQILLRAIERNGSAGVEVVATDEGPGITDIPQAMQDGYSTVGGLGGGLPGVNRLMHELEIRSAPHQKTEVIARRFVGVRHLHDESPDSEWTTLPSANRDAYGKVLMKRNGPTFWFRAKQ